MARQFKVMQGGRVVIQFF